MTHKVSYIEITIDVGEFKTHLCKGPHLLELKI